LLELEVWQFQVDVVDDNIKQMFTCQTDKMWSKFSEEAYRYFTAPHSEVWLRYQFSRESTISYLQTEEQWAKALDWLHGNMRAAQWLAVTMKAKNVVSHATYNKEGM
jgi:hypothetical protein